jgi:hypothetical protein
MPGNPVALRGCRRRGGKLAARRLRQVENVLMPERNAREPQNDERAVQVATVLVGDADNK